MTKPSTLSKKKNQESTIKQKPPTDKALIPALFAGICVTLSALQPNPIIAVGLMLSFALIYAGMPKAASVPPSPSPTLPPEFMKLFTDQSNQLSQVLESSSLNSQALKFIVEYINHNAKK